MDRIVGGTEALEGRYPYMAALLSLEDALSPYDYYSGYGDFNYDFYDTSSYDYYYDYYTNEPNPYYYYFYDYYYYGHVPEYSSEEYLYYYAAGNKKHFCGGSLISSKAVLTAAHCVESVTSDIIEVALNCTDISNLDKCVLINVADIVIHPEWQQVPGTLGDDLALLILSEEVNLPTVTLASTDIIAQSGDIVRNVGWGRTLKVPVPPQKKLQEVDVSIIENDICLEQMKDVFSVLYDNSVDGYLPDDNYIERGNLDTVICTIGDGKSSCNGDSGGPLFYACDTEGVADIQVGVVSFGFTCGGEGIPIAFESVNSAAGFNFIVETLNDFKIEDVKFVESFDGFCPDDPIDQLASPTPFPTFVASEWLCPADYFASLDGCDCECGIQDPDCEVQTRKNLLFGCNSSIEICFQGHCVLSPTISPTWSPTMDPTFLPTTAPTFSPTISPTLASENDPVAIPNPENDSNGLLVGLILTMVVICVLVAIFIVFIYPKMIVDKADTSPKTEK